MSDMNTPWRVEADEINYEARGKLTSNAYIAGYNIYTADGDEVVGCEGIIDPTSDRADFIVHCVNSHASLVEENKRLREALQTAKETIRAWHGPNAWDIYDRASPEMMVINEALEKSNA